MPQLFVGKRHFDQAGGCQAAGLNRLGSEIISKINRIRDIWNRGGAVINGWLSIGDPFCAEIMAEQGFDSLTIDLQHGIVDYAGSVAMLQAMRASAVAPVIRVPWLDPGSIMKALDAGALNIICPMIDTPAQAEQLVSYMHYAPHGTRSFGPTRASYSAGPHYFEHAEEQIVCMAMIESAAAVQNLNAIVATKGLDGVYIGPADLALSIGAGRFNPGFDREEPELDAVILRILEVAKLAGIRAGIHCGTPRYAAHAIERGFDLVTLSTDARILARASAEMVSATRHLRDQAGQQGRDCGSY